MVSNIIVKYRNWTLVFIITPPLCISLSLILPVVLTLAMSHVELFTTNRERPLITGITIITLISWKWESVEIEGPPLADIYLAFFVFIC